MIIIKTTHIYALFTYLFRTETSSIDFSIVVDKFGRNSNACHKHNINLALIVFILWSSHFPTG